MKFTTAITLAALLGNAAFSNAQDANGNLDICNPDKETYNQNSFGCQKTCERPQTGIRNQVKIQCKVSLDGKNVDCFDPTVSAGGCREVDVKIQYKFMNTNKDLELELMYGSYQNKKLSWTAFDGDQVLEQEQTVNLRLAGNKAKKFNIVKTINTCTPYDVEIKSKMPVPDDVKNEIKAAQSGELYQVQQRIQSTCNAHPDYLSPNPPCSPLDLTTDRCGVSGQILLCDAVCKAAWEAKQGGNPGADPGPNDPANPAPGPGPSAPGTDPAPAPKPDVPSPSTPKTKAPSTPKTKAPSTPKSKDGTKAPSTGKGTKQPSSGKGTKQPTMKGKGTPVPVRRQMKNRKVARV